LFSVFRAVVGCSWQWVC